MTSVLLFTGAFVWIIIVLALASRVWRAFREKAELDVADKTIVVTGCDSGFGEGVMQRLIGRGANVVALTYTEEGAAAALDSGAKAALACDLGNPAGQQWAIDFIHQHAGEELWGIVHSAGIALPGFVEYQPLANYQRTLDVNFMAIVALNKAIIPAIKKAKGRIVMISSVDGIVSLPGNAPYDAAKFALEGYADALRMELSFWDVSVSVVNPSTMKTPLVMQFFESHRPTWEAQQREDPNGSWQQAYPADWLNEYIAVNTPNLERIADDPAVTVKDLEHALIARSPRHRYLSGKFAKTFFRALWLMPERWAHAIKLKTIQPEPRR
ncbi:putative 11-cis retinol dehydrogenase [Luminiphilus syltensis NOR5-1B]|uniref:Putative 11-cis retinol dehydrogenase n=1 Tax=Luminiphilus syltensis NOR5-1B TaxID=565045 RepID=B8KW91_9GAMM|nr:SDR family NAD(P)-dependent oxidoreductase [Luminiphilus syltensis]EED34402.1 putative 11-cis retinol dehydrogenase [Luminiphilus syltensis NOR5-1B]